MLDFSGIAIIKTAEKEQGTVATFEIGPLVKGYGNTLGNSLRRVLLSSLEGAAITSVRINNLTHEYTTIPGVKQNVLDIVLRLKNIRIKLAPGETSTVLTLTKKGKGVLTAKDFASSKNVEVINKDYVVAEITDDSATLTIEAIVENGVGYRRADESLRDEIGRIPVDTVYSPVRLVDFTVVPARKGAQADLDKIVLSITTDGTIMPEDAIAQAGVILKNFFNQASLVFGGSEPVKVEPDNTSMSNWKLSEVGIDETIVEKLSAVTIETISEAAAKSKAFYTKEVGLNAKQVKTLAEALSQYNLEFAKDAKKSKKA